MADILASPLAFELCEGGTCGEPKTAKKCQGGNIKYKPEEFDYKCLGVKPMLEWDETIDDVKYTLRFVLCGLGSCGWDQELVSIPVNPWDPNSKMEWRKEIKCSGDCKDDCKCTLFRLQIRGEGFDPKEAKWEYMAKAGKKIGYNDKYIYHVSA